jgi:hypothetical protein
MGMPAAAAPQSRNLNYQDVYTCPVCRHGQIAALTLMDAFACNFCHHIFTANLQTQMVQVADSSQPMAWRWTGKSWLAANRNDGELAWVVWSAAIFLTILPAGIVGLFSYMFPSLDQDAWRFPLVWTGLTFLVHLVMVTWLVVEYHQYPPYVMLKVRLREFRAIR